MSPSLKFLFQAFPLYGDVLLLLCSVFMEPSMGTVRSTRWFIRFRSPSIKENTVDVFVWERTAMFFIISLFSWACSVETTTRKCWRMWRPTPLATWRRWKPFLRSHRRRRGRGSASWSRPSSPSTDILTSPTMRGEQLLRWGLMWRKCIYCVMTNQLCVFVSVWRRCTVSSTTLWCPSVSKMMSNGGKTITALACQPTGQRSRCVLKFHSNTRRRKVHKYFIRSRYSYIRNMVD